MHNLYNTRIIIVKAINERGVAEAILQVAILGPGTPPDEITVRPVQDGFIVHWQAPSVPNGDVTNYILYWNRDPDAELSDWVGQSNQKPTLSLPLVPTNFWPGCPRGNNYRPRGANALCYSTAGNWPSWARHNFAQLRSGHWPQTHPIGNFLANFGA